MSTHKSLAKYTYYIIFTLVFFIHSQQSSGAFYYFKHYQVDEGLLHNNVNCITQDKLGFIWIGTRAGLNRFDGYTFKSYTTDRSKIGSNYIKVLCLDAKGMIWIGTSSGIFKLDPVTEQIQRVGIFSNFNIRDIIVDSKNNLWVLSGGTIYYYDTSLAKLSKFNISASAIDLDTNGYLWIATIENTLKKLDTKTNKILDINLYNFPNFEGRSITKIRLINQSIFVGTIHGLFNINLKNNNSRSILLKNEKGAEVFVRDIFNPFQKDIFYFATESGLYIYNIRTEEITHLKKVPADPYSLNDNAIYSVFEDNRDGVWLGTFFGGLNYFSKENNQFEKYYPLNIQGSISGNAVREICGDEKGNIWIGTEDAGINKLDKSSGRFIQISRDNPLRGPSYPNIHGLLAYKNKLFVGPFFHGLEIIDIPTGRVIDRHPRVPSDRVSTGDIVMSIFRTSENKILVGTTGAGLYEYSEHSKQLTPVIYIPGDSYVYAIAEDHTGTIWTGSLIKGVFYFNPKTGESGNINFNKLNDTTKNAYTVQGIYEDHQYNIWLTTEGGGLFKINQNKQIIKRYTVQDGLPTNSLYRVLEDSQGNLWISTLKGLVCFNMATEKITTFRKANGLITDQFNFNSAYKDENGKMYFGTVKGMIAFQPEYLTRSKTSPPIYITGFFINNETPVFSYNPNERKAILFADSLTLTHLQTTFSIEFAALDFSSANAVQYKYKMEGIDKNWTYLSSNRKAYFTDLPAGTYKFIVQAESNLGYWACTPKTIIIKILPPFWKSTSALVLYTIIALLTIAFVLHKHHTNLERKNKQKIQLFELKKEKEVYHTKMAFFTNVAHEIQTPITLIKGPVEWALSNIDNISLVKRTLDLIRKNTDRLISLTSQLLDFRKMETNQFKLNFAPVNVSRITGNAINYFMPEIEKRNLDFKLILPERHLRAFVDEEAFFKIISNLVSNAVKYAEKTIEVKLYIPVKKGNCFKVRIVNDGIPVPPESQKKIFDPFYRVPAQSHLPGTGIGLCLAKSLAEMHSGKLEYITNPSLFNIFELSLPIYQEIDFANTIEKKQSNEAIFINNR
ncbi:MAG: two-component regulator propeller domain-containing protein [Niabella sp.]